jgi:hypothetical protein
MTRTSTARTLAACLAVAAASLVATAAVAQQVSGVVIADETQTPLEGALVTLLDEDGAARGRAVTDPAGRFSITAPYPGEWQLAVQFLGYRSLVTSPMDVSVGEWVTLAITLATVALAHDPVVVTARRTIRNPAVQRFYERRDRAGRAAFGHFVAREDIGAGGGRRPTDLLRSMPGVRVVPGTPGRGQTVRMAGGCAPAVYVDGLHVNRMSMHDSLDDFVNVQDIEGIEVYRGASSHQTSYHDPSGCGLVLVWTQTESHEPGSGLPWKRILSVLGGMLLFVLVVS